MEHLFCNGHGSLKSGYSLPFIPDGLILVMYTPPGGAMADNLASFIERTLKENPPDNWMHVLNEKITPRIYIKGRETKGMGYCPCPKPFYGVYPKIIIGDGRTSVPNYTLTGSSSLSSSGCYDYEGNNMIPLKSKEAITLQDIFLKSVGKKCVIHWLSCASDYTTFSNHNDFYGFKVSLI